ncbi:MAG: hypothetical protein ABSG81_07610 [Acidimicrobiales bacterium]
MASARAGRRAHNTVAAEDAAMAATVVPHEPAPITATLSSTGPPYGVAPPPGRGRTLTA